MPLWRHQQSSNRMQSDKCLAFSRLLDRLEQRMAAEGLVQHAQPSPAALASRVPFCCDTLTFCQWLQFVFVPRCRALLERQALPGATALVPMAEMSWPDHGLQYPLSLSTLQAIDAFLADGRASA